MRRIGFLGAGKMGEAILAALIRGGLYAPGQILACEALPERRHAIRRRHRVEVTGNPATLPEVCDVIVLAVKPQDLAAALAPLAHTLRARHLLISIAAGKTLASLQTASGGRARIVRVMPNLNVSVGAGMSVFALGAHTRPADRKLVTRLLGCCGECLELDERHFDSVTALSGSGPAFFAYLMQALTDAAVLLDLPADAARLLANQTMLGTALYLRQTGQEPAAFIQAVCSPKGTTAAGLSVLEKSSVKSALARTLQAAAKRSGELNRG